MAAWERLQQDAVAPRRGHSACIAGQRMVVFGGEHGAPLADLAVLDTDTMRWRRPSLSGPIAALGPRYAHSAVADDGRLFLFGGSILDPSGCIQKLGDLWVIDTAMYEIRRPVCFGPPPPARCGHAASCVAGHLVIFGGMADVALNDVWILDLGSLVWRELAMPAVAGPFPSPRSHLTATAVGNHLIFFGGWNGSPWASQLSNSMHILSLAPGLSRATWRSPLLEGPAPPPRNVHSAVVLDGSFYVFGGWDRRSTFGDLFRCDLGGILDFLDYEDLRARWGAGKSGLCAWIEGFAERHSALLDSPEYSDVTLRLGDRVLSAHKGVLSAHSPYFKALFASGMQDAQSSAHEIGPICAGHSPSFPTFEAFIRYLYTGLPPGGPHRYAELACLADFYNDPFLAQWAKDRFREAIRTEDTIALMAEAEWFHQPDLAQACVDWTAAHPPSAPPSDSHLDGMPP